MTRRVCGRPAGRLVDLLPVLWTASLWSACAVPVCADEPLRYESHIRPIFAAKCGACHGAERRRAGLDLLDAAALLEGSESGRVLVEGRAESSRLWEVIADGEMPPAGKPSLSDAERQRIRRWIEQGAPFQVDPQRDQVDQHDVIPILLLRCTVCHGAQRQEGGLDLRTRASILKGGESGPAAAPGHPAQSRLVQRIVAGEMPPRRKLVEFSVKPMEAAELEVVRSWIAAGLPESDTAPDVATGEGDPLVTDADRAFWSFRAPRRPPTPPVASARVRSPIDAFVLARLRERGLGFAAEADRATLIRRVTFDLLGVPPAPDEVREFMRDRDPFAYERLVDRLLASPRYGERWGRHWLDVAGYADSEGAQNEDRVRPHMWRYRDYVVRAFNADKAYDRFLLEQIAGDELAEYRNTETIDSALYDNLVATGFLRTAPDRTFAGITNFVPDRLEVIADEIQILSSAVLGLTIQCARCHSHKFDPLPQRDYYRLAAVLKDALDEHDWLKPAERTLTFVTTAERARWESEQQRLDAEIARRRAQLDATSDEAERKQLKSEIETLDQQRPPEPKIRALWSRGRPSPMYLLRRGDPLRPGPPVGPGVPSVLTDGKTPFDVVPPRDGVTGRRLALARWLVDPAHPLTARVMVNRIWKHHFGRGIVATLDDFGRAGARPTHPQLLDWLARQFVHGGWSIKRLHRQLLTSTVYRQRSAIDSVRRERDPENQWYSRMPLRRMEAEVVRDALLAVAGQLDGAQYGPPQAVDARDDGLVVSRASEGGYRRSVYVQQRRTRPLTLLESFDLPQMGPNCVARGESIAAPQALHLLNNKTVYAWAAAFAERVFRRAGADPQRQIEEVHWLAYGRAAEPDERRMARAMLAALTAEWVERGAEDAPRRALVNYCHAVMNSAAFVYID